MAAKKRPAREAAKLREDTAETAFRTLQEAIGERPKSLPTGERPKSQRNPEAVKRGRKGGEAGGDSRADALSPERRQEIARKAARARWKKES